MARMIVAPDAAYHLSFLEAMLEHARAGDIMQGTASSQLRGAEDPKAFARWVDELRGAADPVNGPEGRVPASFWWLVEDGSYLGGVTLRHACPPGEVRLIGGNIGYSVRPRARRQGCATQLARHALSAAAGRGIDTARISHEASDEGSRQVILAVGGVCDGRQTFSEDGKDYLLYAIPTAPYAGAEGHVF